MVVPVFLKNKVDELDAANVLPDTRIAPIN
jgi:hypothetical protein